MTTKRPRLAPIKVECRMCPFVATGSAWRPVRRAVAAHVAAKHGKAGAL